MESLTRGGHLSRAVSIVDKSRSIHVHTLFSAAY